MKKHRNSVDQAGRNVDASVNRALRNALHTVFGRRGVASATSAGLLGAALCGLPISATGDGFPARLPLSSLDGTNGFTIRSSERTGAGKSVSGVGDFNGDGLDDVIIGARWADPNGVEDAGESYVLFGSAAAFPAVVELTALDGTNGFTLRGVQADDESGNVVSGAGDVNGDGIDDIVIGARNASRDGGYPGEAYVVFGHVGTFAPVLDLSTLDGAIGFVTRGEGIEQAAASVSAAGDVNADGVGDLIVGAEVSDSAYVVYGNRAPFDPLMHLADLDGSNGFVARGGDSTGDSASKAGDVNGDGIDDFIAGAYRADIGNLDNVGASYVVFGTPAGFPESLDLSVLNGRNGFSVVGIQEFEEMGFAVSGIGDLNGDGVDDIAVGEPYGPCCSGRHDGKCYVVFGSRAAFPAQLTVADLNGTNGFVAEGSGFNAAACKSVSGAGDVNGDAVDDFIVGAPNANSKARIGRYAYHYEGAAYVVFGFQGAFPSVLELEHLDGTDGFKIEGIEDYSETGESVAGAGDMNGDGVDDVIVGTGSVGEIYVVFGRITDADGDGVPDTVDNCSHFANPDQRDTDQDAIGNACDADFDQNCVVNFTDLGVMKINFFHTGDRVTDLNGDGVTNFVDLAALKAGFFEPPGPSGFPNSCGV